MPRKSIESDFLKIVIYKTSKGPELEVRLEKETIWLDAHQIAMLFGTQRPAIVKHVNNIYQTGELSKINLFHFGTGCRGRKDKKNEPI